VGPVVPAALLGVSAPVREYILVREHIPVREHILVRELILIRCVSERTRSRALQGV